MSKINTSVCFRVHNYDHWLELQYDLAAMVYTVDKYSTEVLKDNPRFKGLYLHIETDFTVCLHDHTLGAEVVPNFEYIVNELPQQPKGKGSMKLKNVKVGQRVKIKKRVGFNNQDTFTIENNSQRYGTVMEVRPDTTWPVKIKPDNRFGWTCGNAEDLKLIEDAE